MNPSLVQLLLAVSGLLSLWWSQGEDPVQRRWAPIIGLCGQPFWLLFVYDASRQGLDVRGLAVVVFAFSVVYVRGVWMQWGKR